MKTKTVVSALLAIAAFALASCASKAPTVPVQQSGYGAQGSGYGYVPQK